MEERVDLTHALLNRYSRKMALVGLVQSILELKVMDNVVQMSVVKVNICILMEHAWTVQHTHNSPATKKNVLLRHVAKDKLYR